MRLEKQAQQNITPQLVDYLLYNLPALKEQAAQIHPRQTQVYAVLYQRGRDDDRC